MTTRRLSATTLAAYQRAGGLSYDLTTLAEERRAELARAADEVEVSDSDRQLMLCAWNALALQTLGDALTGTAGRRVASALILASPNQWERVTASKDPAGGVGNLLATPDSAVPAATAGIGVGASNQKQFVAIAYTAYGTRCVFRFVYRTGIVSISP
jgi:hypothetical protein